PIGRALLYAEAIYLQAQRSPMPELRLVVLALQDRLVYAPTFQAALNALLGSGASTLSAATGVAANAPAQAQPAAAAGAAPAPSAPPRQTDPRSLAAEAAR